MGAKGKEVVFLVFLTLIVKLAISTELQPLNVNLTVYTPGQLTFTWESSSSNFIITSHGCGLCPSMSREKTVTCYDIDLSVRTSNCTFVVESVIDGVAGTATSAVIPPDLETVLTENPTDAHTCFGENATFTCAALTPVFWTINDTPAEQYTSLLSYQTQPGWSSTLYILVVNQTNTFTIQCRTKAHNVLVISSVARIHTPAPKIPPPMGVTVTSTDSVAKLTWNPPLEFQCSFDYIIHVNYSNHEPFTVSTSELFYEFNLSVGCVSTFAVQAKSSSLMGFKSEVTTLEDVAKLQCQERLEQKVVFNCGHHNKVHVLFWIVTILACCY